MLDKYFEKYEPIDGEKPSKRQIKADTAAVMSLIESSKAETPIRSVKTGRRFRAPLVAAAAAVSVLTIGTVSVGAYYDWDFGAVLKSWLGSEDKLHSVISEVKTSNTVNTFDELDIRVGGALKCEGLNIVFFDIERTDGKIFDTSTYTPKASDGSTSELYGEIPRTVSFEQISVTHQKMLIKDNVYSNKMIDYVHSFSVDDDSSDGKVTVAIAWTDDNAVGASDVVEITLGNLCTFEYAVNGLDKSVGGNDRRLLWLSRSADSQRFIPGKYSADITLNKNDCETRSGRVTEEIREALFPRIGEFEGYDPVIERVYVSPMAIGLKGNSSGLAELLHYGSDAEVLMKDGSVVGINSHDNLSEFIGKDERNLMCHDTSTIVDCKIILSEAIDVNDAAAVVLNGVKIPLD